MNFQENNLQEERKYSANLPPFNPGEPPSHKTYGGYYSLLEGEGNDTERLLQPVEGTEHYVDTFQVGVPSGDCSIHLRVRPAVLPELKPVVTHAVLVDGGNDGVGVRGMARKATEGIKRCLYEIDESYSFERPDEKKLIFDAWVVTHWDEDHWEGAMGMWRSELDLSLQDTDYSPRFRRLGTEHTRLYCPNWEPSPKPTQLHGAGGPTAVLRDLMRVTKSDGEPMSVHLKVPTPAKYDGPLQHGKVFHLPHYQCGTDDKLYVDPHEVIGVDFFTGIQCGDWPSAGDTFYPKVADTQWPIFVCLGLSGMVVGEGVRGARAINHASYMESLAKTWTDAKKPAIIDTQSNANLQPNVPVITLPDDAGNGIQGLTLDDTDLTPATPTMVLILSSEEPPSINELKVEQECDAAEEPVRFSEDPNAAGLKDAAAPGEQQSINADDEDPDEHETDLPQTAQNMISIMAGLMWKDRRLSLLYMGDAIAHTELKLATALQARGVKMVTVLKLSHHGSRGSTPADFLAAVNPEKCVVSAGTRFNHPDPVVLRRLSTHYQAANQTAPKFRLYTLRPPRYIRNRFYSPNFKPDVEFFARIRRWNTLSPTHRTSRILSTVLSAMHHHDAYTGHQVSAQSYSPAHLDFTGQRVISWKPEHPAYNYEKHPDYVKKRDSIEVRTAYLKIRSTSGVGDGLIAHYVVPVKRTYQNRPTEVPVPTDDLFSGALVLSQVPPSELIRDVREKLEIVLSQANLRTLQNFLEIEGNPKTHSQLELNGLRSSIGHFLLKRPDNDSNANPFTRNDKYEKERAVRKYVPKTPVVVPTEETYYRGPFDNDTEDEATDGKMEEEKESSSETSDASNIEEDEPSPVYTVEEHMGGQTVKVKMLDHAEKFRKEFGSFDDLYTATLDWLKGFPELAINLAHKLGVVDGNHATETELIEYLMKTVSEPQDNQSNITEVQLEIDQSDSPPPQQGVGGSKLVDDLRRTEMYENQDDEEEPKTKGENKKPDNVIEGRRLKGKVEQKKDENERKMELY